MLPGTFNVQLKCLLLFLQDFHKDILGLEMCQKVKIKVRVTLFWLMTTQSFLTQISIQSFMALGHIP